MPVSISDLWVPDLWVQDTAEKVRTTPAFINSGIAVRNAEMDGYASGAGLTVNLPYFRDISDQADAPQVQGAAPTMQGLGSGKQIATILNRETGNDVNALAGQVSGTDPVAYITGQLAIRRLKQRQTTLLNIVRGLFKSALTPNQLNAFTEDGANANATSHGISNLRVIDSTAKLGELGDFTGGGIAMHPIIRTALQKQDENAFKTFSQGGLTFETYKGLRVTTSNLLVRGGTTSGYVYDTYIFAPGTVAWGEKPQAGDTIDVASLQFEPIRSKNQAAIYDRTRFMMHVAGTKWLGTPAGQSATNAELAVGANWGLDYSSSDRVPVLQINTNL